MGLISDPVNNLPFTFIAPLGAHNHDIAAHLNPFAKRISLIDLETTTLKKGQR